MEDLSLIKYKYDVGVYGINILINLVEEQKITYKQFKEITDFDYGGITLSKMDLEKTKV